MQEPPKRRVHAVVFVLMLLASAIVAGTIYFAKPHQPGALRVTVLDVGQGDSIVVETPNGHVMLIDGGGANGEKTVDPGHVGERVVVPYLRYRGIQKIDLLVLTHPHGDHVGGLIAVLQSIPVGQVMDGTILPYPTIGYTQFLQSIRTLKIPYTHAVRGMHIDLGAGVSADVLNPPATGRAYGSLPDNSTVNNYSAVLRLTYGSTHFMLDGDAQDEAEQNMLNAGLNVSADVLKTGHHGAGNASSDPWLAAVHPQYAAISCGRHNHFGHPHPLTLARLAAHHIIVFRTDQNGAITYTSDGTTVTAVPFIAK